jgi:hypothetical protein
MEQKKAAMLVIVVESEWLRWFVSAIQLDGTTVPLMCSEVDDLEKYRCLPFDEQVGFLRHRFCGVLQRGCDRLWARNSKACQFVFVFQGLLAETSGQLTQTVADHFAEWMLKPPVAVFAELKDGGLSRLAGTIDAELDALLVKQLSTVVAAHEEASVWELARQKGEWCVPKTECH